MRKLTEGGAVSVDAGVGGDSDDSDWPSTVTANSWGVRVRVHNAHTIASPPSHHHHHIITLLGVRTLGLFLFRRLFVGGEFSFAGLGGRLGGRLGG